MYVSVCMWLCEGERGEVPAMIMYRKGGNWISGITILNLILIYQITGDPHHPDVYFQILSEIKQLIKDWIIVVGNIQSWYSEREMGVDIVWLVKEGFLGKVMDKLRALKFK